MLCAMLLAPGQKNAFSFFPPLVSPEKEEGNIPLMRFCLRCLKAEFSFFERHHSIYRKIALP